MCFVGPVPRSPVPVPSLDPSSERGLPGDGASSLRMVLVSTEEGQPSDSVIRPGEEVDKSKGGVTFVLFFTLPSFTGVRVVGLIYFCFFLERVQTLSRTQFVFLLMNRSRNVCGPVIT